MMQTAHGATRLLDRPATEYPTCATIPDRLHQVSYSCHGPHLHKQTRFSKQNKDKRKTKQNETPRFEFKPRQVNDSSQSNQETDHLVSHIASLHFKCLKNSSEVSFSAFSLFSQKFVFQHSKNKLFRT
jgi:hypothetical protein